MLAGIVLGGCGQAATPGAEKTDDRKPMQTVSETTGKGSGPLEGAGPGRLPEPPASTLSYEGETVRAGLGSYCLRSVCADKIGIPISDRALTVPAGSVLTFEYGGAKLDSMSAGAEEVRPGDRIRKFDDGDILMPEEGSDARKTVRLEARRSGSRARIAAKMPAGEYALTVFVRLPEGDATYGFHVIVE